MEKYEYIEEFILAIQEEYPELEINYRYNEELDEYDVIHNSPNLAKNDREFGNFVHEKAQEYLFANDVVNFYFDYE